MPSSVRVLDSTARDPAQELALDVLVGLSEHPKRLPSRLFYDARGSELFAQICDTADYYPTRVEHRILTDHVGRIAEAAGVQPFNLVELGAGDGLDHDARAARERHRAV